MGCRRRNNLIRQRSRALRFQRTATLRLGSANSSSRQQHVLLMHYGMARAGVRVPLLDIFHVHVQCFNQHNYRSLALLQLLHHNLYAPPTLFLRKSTVCFLPSHAYYKCTSKLSPPTAEKGFCFLVEKKKKYLCFFFSCKIKIL